MGQIPAGSCTSPARLKGLSKNGVCARPRNSVEADGVAPDTRRSAERALGRIVDGASGCSIGRAGTGRDELEVARSGLRGAGDAVCGLRDVVGEPLAVERGAAEQELEVEEWRPARAGAVEPVPVLQLVDHALAVGHPLLVRPDAALALAALTGGESLALCIALRLALFGQHRRLRRDVGDQAASVDVPPDALGGKAGVGADRGEFGAGEAGAVEDRVEPITLVAVRLLAEAGDDTARLRVDRHLAAVDKVRPLTRFPAQLRVGIGARDRARVRAAALRGRTRTRLGQRKLRRRRCFRPLALGRLLLARLVADDREARPQAGERSVRLGVEAVDREMRALDQTMLATKSERAQEEALEQLPVDETTRLRMRERLVHGQTLVEAVAEEPPEIETQARDTAQLARRANPLESGRHHQLDEHDRIDRGTAHL